MLSWLPLPSTRDPPGVPPTWRSVPLDISIDDFALDLHQDLVVLVEMLLPGTTTLQVYLRAFQTLQPHPRAAAGLLTAECDPVSVNSTIVIDLTGCLLGLLFNYDHTGFTDKDALTVWDWTTGQMLCVRPPRFASRITNRFAEAAEFALKAHFIPFLGRGHVPRAQRRR